MDTKNKGIIGYYTADGDIHWNIEIMKEIDKPITTEDKKALKSYMGAVKRRGK